MRSAPTLAFSRTAARISASPSRDPVGDAGVGHLVAAVAGECGAVLYAVGGAERAGGHEKPGAGDEALLHGHAEACLQPAAIPDGGVAGLQRVLDDAGDAKGAGTAGFGHTPAAEEVVGEGSQVVVAVNETGHHGVAAYVQNLSSFRYCHRRAWPCGRDPAIVADEDGPIGQRLASLPVYQRAANYRLHINPPVANESLAGYHNMVR